MSMPVYFNEPISILQKSAETMEYADILDRACAENDSVRRTALITAHCISAWTNIERRMNKPFNPLLGETFEYVTNEYRIICE